MGKLTNLRPSLGRLGSALTYSNPSAKPQSVQAPAPPRWKAWKKTAKWQKFRWSILVRDTFRCAMCGRVQSDTSMLAADHIIPHRGDLRLFWDAANVQTLCTEPCHNKHKQRLEASMPQGVWY